MMLLDLVSKRSLAVLCGVAALVAPSLAMKNAGRVGIESLVGTRDGGLSNNHGYRESVHAAAPQAEKATYAYNLEKAARSPEEHRARQMGRVIAAAPADT